VLDSLNLDQIADDIAEVIGQAERNKAFREGSYGTLRCVAIDGWEPFSSPGRRGVLRPPVPLRTVRDSFPSYGSSLPKGHPCGTPRLLHLVQMAKAQNARADNAGSRRASRSFRRRAK
jgi:hypothetical protein